MHLTVLQLTQQLNCPKEEMYASHLHNGTFLYLYLINILVLSSVFIFTFSLSLLSSGGLNQSASAFPAETVRFSGL